MNSALEHVRCTQGELVASRFLESVDQPGADVTAGTLTHCLSLTFMPRVVKSIYLYNCFQNLTFLEGKRKCWFRG